MSSSNSRAPSSASLRWWSARMRAPRPIATGFVATAHAIRDRIIYHWLAAERASTAKGQKRVYYLSLEFLDRASAVRCVLQSGPRRYPTRRAGQWRSGAPRRLFPGEHGELSFGNPWSSRPEVIPDRQHQAASGPADTQGMARRSATRIWFLGVRLDPGPSRQWHLQAMASEWPFFQTLLSNMDMVLAKSDIRNRCPL